ncbi:MAG TPA: histidine kinase [Gaiellaceae bacterium]|nr:histidine kinase [Gaiellaceae bacterium]
MRTLRLAAAAVAGATFVFTGLAVVRAGSVLDWIPHWLTPFLALAFVAPATVGLLVALRRPRNRIAWILLLGPFAMTIQLPLGLALGEGWALQLDRAMWPLLYAWPTAVAYVFPDGRLLSRRWRWVAGGALVSFLGFVTISLLDPAPFYGEDASVRNPLAETAVGEWVERSDLGWLWVAFWLGMLASLVAGAVAVALRLRRSSGIERLQTMWLAWAAALVPLGLLLCGAASLALGDSVFDWILFPFLLVTQAAVAAAVGVAVVRYRLYAIERIVNRTLVYACVTFLLLAVYIGITVAVGVAVGQRSPWAATIATLAVALAFRPLRTRIQDRVDRRFSRARYEGVRRVRTFEDEVRSGRRAPEEIRLVLAETLADPLAELYFWLPETEAYVDPNGAILADLPNDGRARTDVRRAEGRTAVLLHDPALLERRDLLDSVLDAAALSVEIARLRVEVRLRLAEVEASRTRIVEAGYEERRRLERDLHDGAQQRLVSLGVQLRRLQLALPRGAEILSPALDTIVAEVGAAIADLRQIAAGVRPARLDEGLAAALRDLARTSPVPVDVVVPSQRVAASVEAAAYFVACEALTNAVKYASPSRVAVRAVRENGELRVSVSDDGIGGAVIRRGSGLAGLRDRVASHGGTLEVVSPHGMGTRIEAVIPCES